MVALTITTITIILSILSYGTKSSRFRVEFFLDVWFLDNGFGISLMLHHVQNDSKFPL